VMLAADQNICQIVTHETYTTPSSRYPTPHTTRATG
jgi:hypothetical protein